MADTTAVAKQAEVEITEDQFNALLIKGDLSGLGMSLRAKFLFRLAEKMGLDPWRRPFDLLTTKDNRVIVYANKGCAQQIRENLGIKLDVVYKGALRLQAKRLITVEDGVQKTFDYYECDPDIYEVEVKATAKDGREEVEIGTAHLAGLDPQQKKDAPLKAITRAKRRAILNLATISLPDESETDYARATPPRRMEVREAPPVEAETFNPETGEVTEPEQAAPTPTPTPAPQRTMPRAMPRAGGGVAPRGIILPPPVAPTKPPVK